MKKKIYLTILLIFALSLITNIITVKSVSVEVSVELTNPPPLILLSPENKTYLTNESLLLNYSVINANTILYNLDNSANIIIIFPIYFNTSQGSHILYLYAINSQGTTVKNVSFFVNSTKFVILYNEYNSFRKGSSTDFITYSYEDIQTLSNIVLENIEYGKINFNEVINLTDDEDITDNLLDLDTHINISYNRIELNSTALPNFNKFATLYFYNLTFSNPRVLMNGNVCSASRCTEKSYLGGTLKFNVTEFTIYSVEETPVVVPLSGGGGGGGGKRIKEIETFFIVDKEFIKIKLKTGEELRMPLTITNDHVSYLDFKLESSIQELPLFSETEFRIEKGESKEIQLIFNAKKYFELGVYPGKIIIETKEKVMEIPEIIEIESKKVIFDVILDIPSKYKEIFAGEKLLLQLTIFNLGSVEETDVIIDYLIKDFEGNIIFSEEEGVKVEDQATFSKIIMIQENIRSGDYVVIAQVKYDGGVGTSSNIFRIKSKKSFLGKYWINLLAILIIILAGLIILILKRRNKEIKEIYNIR